MEVRHYSDRAAIAANQNVKEKKYWLEQLSGDLVKSFFPYDLSGVKEEEPRNCSRAVESINFPNDLVLKLEKISSGIDIKLHMVLTAGLVLLLNKYTGNRDVLSGSPVLKQEIEADFINSILVFRNRLEENMSFKELLLQVRETIISASENQNFPTEVLPDLLNIPVYENEFPLFDVVLLLENIHDKSYLKDIDYNMLFSFRRSPDRIEVVIEYNSQKYSKRIIEQIFSHFVRIMERALTDLNVKLADIDMLSEQERQQLLLDFSANDIDFPRDKTFQQLFEEQVGKTPQDIAVVAQGADRILSYKELNEKANRLALVLRERGVTGDTITAIMVGRSLEMIIGVIAILKAGGAYLPIDPEYPDERIEFMLADSKTRFLVTQAYLKDKPDFDGEIVPVEEELANSNEAINLELINSPTDLVYVIYTSGSTGKPKGVMVQHDHFVNLAYGWQREYRLLEMEVVLLQMASISFDVFAGDLARTFLNGGKMVINPLMAVEPESMYQLIKSHQVTLFESTPSYIIPFMQYIYENDLEIASLQLLILGSDICPFPDYKKLLARFGKQMRIINSYGVTETTIDSSYYEEYIEESMPSSGNVPIGKPLPNVKFYILDLAGKPLPIGVPGELYTGGRSVARGYLYREELTAERFLPNPFTAGQHMYKTGDLARWLPDGNVEFLGRVDFQVKIRGYRIELGEIEHKLREHADIKEAVVVEKTEKGGDKYLYGYFVSEKNPDPAELRDYLNRRLPDYMVPWFYTRLEKIPLTHNGKIDLKALPEPQAAEEKEYAAPRNEKEKK
ncbi:MAG: amino acid adenylation domain-containing protein, partial [Candidatus Aminicenantes bacterium]|nr:amino acid adenylation domain-containing protein [Candidatus Aminicenantes bacterium]